MAARGLELGGFERAQGCSARHCCTACSTACCTSCRVAAWSRCSATACATRIWTVAYRKSISAWPIFGRSRCISPASSGASSVTACAASSSLMRPARAESRTVCRRNNLSRVSSEADRTWIVSPTTSNVPSGSSAHAPQRGHCSRLPSKTSPVTFPEIPSRCESKISPQFGQKAGN
jgi:hypothetical protein